MIPDFIEEPSAAHQILPAGIHDASLDEIEQALVVDFESSVTRRRIFDGWQAYRLLIMRIVPIQQEFVDGSFVTDKLNPKDVDLSFWVDAEDLVALPKADQVAVDSLFTIGGVMESYGCDAYLVPRCSIGHPAFPAFQRMLWTDGHWRSVRDKNRSIVDGVHKGYVRVVDS